MSNQHKFSESGEVNISICFNGTSSSKELISNKMSSKQKKRVFEVFHKKEMICSVPDSISNKVEEKQSIYQYKCIYCGNKYNNMNRFEAHMRIHVSYIYYIIIQTGEKPYKCPFCCKIFTEKGNLKVHIRIHTNDRPYHCPFKDICKQSFKTKSQLSDHILKHTQVKNYRCVECKACFSRKSRLKIHLMIHKGEKPFQCNICQKKFREKSNYNFHIKKHFSKTSKNDKQNQLNYKNDDFMDNNINGFGLFQNITPYKSSDFNINTNFSNNNENDFNNYLLEFNNSDNFINKIKESMMKLSNINNKNYNNQFNNNYQFMNQIPNKFNIRTFNFEKEDDFNLPDDLLNKDEMNYFNDKNLLFGKNSSFEPKINSKYESPYNDDYMNSNKEEKNKFEPNYENNMNLGDNIFINNNYNPSNEIIIQNNGNIGFGIDNRVYNNYYQINLTYPFNLEQMFLKDNFNY